jgi:hypothetical protein
MKCTVSASWSIFQGQGGLCQKFGSLQGTWIKNKDYTQNQTEALDISKPM